MVTREYPAREAECPDFVNAGMIARRLSEEIGRARRAEKAFKRAVAHVVEEHRCRRQSLALWWGGRAVWVPASTARVSPRRRPHS